MAINGGLGNQLFQWCFAHSLVADKKVVLDLLFDGEDIKFQQLDFRLSELVARCHHIKKETTGEISGPKFRKFWHGVNYLWLIPSKIIRSLLTQLGYYRENPIQSASQSKHMPKNIFYAYGYFQHDKIVEGVWDLVEFELMPYLQTVINQVIRKFNLESRYTVIHVRCYPEKGYTHSPIHVSNLSKNYYVNWLKENPTENLILLTENAEEVTELISLLRPTIVLDREMTSPWETLAIMANSSRMLGSNSSLSWWGAKLSALRGGEVWLPAQWSYWKNIDPTKILFDSCNIAEDDWDISGFDKSHKN